MRMSRLAYVASREYSKRLGAHAAKAIELGERRGTQPVCGELLISPESAIRHTQVEDEVLALVGAGMSRDLFRRASDHHLMDVTTNQHFAVPIGSRQRLVVAALANQGQRADSCSLLLTSFIGSRRQWQQGVLVSHQPLTDGLIMTTQPVVQSTAAALQQLRVELSEAGRVRDRHHEVAPRIADQPFDLALVVALAWPAEAVGEQVVGLQLAEDPSP